MTITQRQFSVLSLVSFKSVKYLAQNNYFSFKKEQLLSIYS